MVLLSRHIRSVAPLASRGLCTSSKASFLAARPAFSRASPASSTLPRKLPGQLNSIRTLTTTRQNQVKVLAVLYDGGQHAKDLPGGALPRRLAELSAGMTGRCGARRSIADTSASSRPLPSSTLHPHPSPNFLAMCKLRNSQCGVPGLLGTTENELGIRKWLEDQGHTLVTTSDKEGENSKFDQELVDAEIIITTPFHPGYLTAERLAKAKNLKLAVTAGIGSDHVDLNAANKTNGGVTVAEVTGSNVVSVAEHVVMTILVLIRNFVPAHEQIERGDWDVAAVAKQEYDLEGKTVGTVAIGRIGERVLRRLKAFDCKELLYYDYQPLSAEKEAEIGCRRVEDLEELLAQCDVVTINAPLHEKTRGLFNKDLISKMKKGSYLINTARGAIVVKEDVADALKSGHLAGYGGDVWFPQPAPGDHSLRTAKNPFGGGNAMVPHMSGTSLDAQKRYADGTKAIIDSYLSGREDYKPEDLIVHKGDYATKAYGQREKNLAAPLGGNPRPVGSGRQAKGEWGRPEARGVLPSSSQHAISLPKQQDTELNSASFVLLLPRSHARAILPKTTRLRHVSVIVSRHSHT
ncbi:D-isomer specific 2-hydroxyacid dehydrogenase [Colletotrichum lupini]|uniref:Formate dehydrogenase n=1 Tax=Colletotrichum lupini TaxID=145971 RepID=A0A9Q8SRN1_9PEZI|nr:D-isomer specific 2-hydroxyacid dehydrogenase [Colletotrichum lupini]UQC82294.1 D-isomer specific 2-hydroxyacid dehydrogenase [Colletotrichum lupini]